MFSQTSMKYLNQRYQYKNNNNKSCRKCLDLLKNVRESKNEGSKLFVKILNNK